MNVVATLTAAFEMISSNTGEELQQMHVRAFQQQHVLLLLAAHAAQQQMLRKQQIEVAADAVSSRYRKQQIAE